MSVLATKDVQSRAQQALAGSPIYALHELQVEQQDERAVDSRTRCQLLPQAAGAGNHRAAVDGVEIINAIQVPLGRAGV